MSLAYATVNRLLGDIVKVTPTSKVVGDMALFMLVKGLTEREIEDMKTVRERFGEGVSDLRLTRVIYQFDYPFSAAGVVDLLREHYGPTTRAFAALSGDQQKALYAELLALWSSHDQSSDPNRTVVDAEYLEVVGVRAAR